jgi:hypothetical protein
MEKELLSFEDKGLLYRVVAEDKKVFLVRQGILVLPHVFEEPIKERISQIMLDALRSAFKAGEENRSSDILALLGKK